jgi:hypothetical protein
MKTAKQQRGTALTSFLIGGLVVILLVITGLRMIPAYIQNAKINNVLNAMKHDPDLTQANLGQYQASFAKRASIDNITAITSGQIEITDGGMLTAHYSETIPLMGNVSLLLEFNPRSGQ